MTMKCKSCGGINIVLANRAASEGVEPITERMQENDPFCFYCWAFVEVTE